MEDPAQLSPDEALEKLKEGNRRFMMGSGKASDRPQFAKPQDFIDAQRPFAAVIGCADSRVPPEILFDQGIGSLFVIRVAGNLAQTSQIGSVEFAVKHLGVKLVLVLGHSHCGAVKAALSELKEPGQDLSPHLKEMVNHMCPSLKSLVEEEDNNSSEFFNHAVQRNVIHSTQELVNNSNIIGDARREGRLGVVGAQYFLETGKVQFLEKVFQ